MINDRIKLVIEKITIIISQKNLLM